MSHTETFYFCEAHGKTYDVRNSLKMLGFQFDGGRRLWFNPAVTEADKKVLEATAKNWPAVTLKFHSPKQETTPF